MSHYGDTADAVKLSSKKYIVNGAICGVAERLNEWFNGVWRDLD